MVTATENAIVYMVLEGKSPDTTTITATAVSIIETVAYKQLTLTTTDTMNSNFVLYETDSSGNISVAILYG